MNFKIWLGMGVSLILAFIYIALQIFFYTLIPNAISGIITLFVIIAAFGVTLTKQFLNSLPGFFADMTRLGLEFVPKINELLGISMAELGIFNIKIDYYPIFLHTIIFVVFFHVASCIKFSRLK
ncbi:hypothetical protein ACFL96_04805 [Thermoproteota archaeon]